MQQPFCVLFFNFKGIAANVYAAGEFVSLGDTLLGVVEYDGDLAGSAFHNVVIS